MEGPIRARRVDLSGQLQGEYRFDVARQVFYYSPDGCKISGLAPGAELSLAEVLALRHVADQEQVRAAITEALDTGLTLVSTHRFHRADDRSVRLGTMTLVSVADDQGEVREIRGHFVDVTDELNPSRVEACTGVIAVVVLDSVPVVVTAGELDLLTHADLAEALHDAASWASGDLCVDMSLLRFADARAVRAVISTARNLGPGRRLVCVRPPLIVARVMRVLEDLVTPGLALVPRQRDGPEE